ncbi:MAG: hypothetical protein AAF412_04455 [Pseudomonadota bacterium]
MRKTSLLLALIISLSAPVAFAGVEEMKACSGKLPDQAQTILQHLVPKLQKGADVPALMRSTVIDLVKSGEIDRSSARDNAIAAGECLKLLRA